MGIKFELIDDEIMKKESVFEAQPDGTDSDKKLTSTPVSRVKEVCMNLEAIANGSFPVNLFERECQFNVWSLNILSSNGFSSSEIS